MTAQNSIYRRLQEHIDKMPIGLPKSEKGLDIKLLKHLFTPEEAVIALELSALPESLERIYKRLDKTGLSIQDVEQILDRLVQKGAILNCKYRAKKKYGKYYSKAMLAIGMFELQAGRLTKEFAQDFSDYLEETFYKYFHSKKTSQMRIIPINQSITPDNYIATYDNVRDIIKNTEQKICLLKCVCREGKDLLQEPCKRIGIRETCLVFEESASLMLDMGRGRLITKEIALNVLENAEKSGLILEASNNQKPHFICCCCGCCCEAIKSLKLFPKPSEYCHSNYQSKIDPANCTGCKLCVQICPMEAISVNNKKALVNYDRCIGCGVCVTKCKFDAIQMDKKTNEYIPPKNHDSLYQKILFERVGVSGMLKILPKAILGQKI